MQATSGMTTERAHKSTWILVASRNTATIFGSDGPRVPMNIIQHIDNLRGRPHSGALDSDRPERAFDHRHALANEESANERVEHDFAVALAELLDRRRTDGAFDRLIIIAGPRLLGRLRAAISEPTRRSIEVELNKELVSPRQEVVRKQLEGLAHV